MCDICEAGRLDALSDADMINELRRRGGYTIVHENREASDEEVLTVARRNQKRWQGTLDILAESGRNAAPEEELLEPPSVRERRLNNG